MNDLWRDIREPVLEELGHWIDVIDRDAGAYARDVAADLARPGSPGRQGPRPPAGMPRQIAAAIREQVLDQATMRRRQHAGHIAQARAAGRETALSGRRP